MVSSQSLAEHLNREAEWVTWEQACGLIGCSEPTLMKFIQSGQIVRRIAPRSVPSLERLSVRATADLWREKQRQTSQRRDERRSRPSQSEPPDTESVWITATVAGIALGITANAVRQRVAAGKLPGVIKQRRLWLRRQDVEVAAAARHFFISEKASDES